MDSGLTRYQRAHLWEWYAVAVLLVWGLGGCAPHLIADGVGTDLPQAGTTVAVWGNHRIAEDTATLWLKRHHVQVIDSVQVRAQLTADASSRALIPSEKQVLEVAGRLGAHQLIIVHREGDFRAPAVIVKAISLPSHTVSWIGSARYEDYLRYPLADHMVTAACRALDAAWGISGEDKDSHCERGVPPARGDAAASSSSAKGSTP